MNSFTIYYAWSFFMPILGIIVAILFLYILNKIAKELKRHNDFNENKNR